MGKILFKKKKCTTACSKTSHYVIQIQNIWHSGNTISLTMSQSEHTCCTDLNSFYTGVTLSACLKVQSNSLLWLQFLYFMLARAQKNIKIVTCNIQSYGAIVIPLLGNG